MGTLIKLNCDPTVENHSRCIFYGHLIARDKSWAVYLRDDDEIFVFYDKVSRAVHILDDTRELSAYLDEHSYRNVLQALSARKNNTHETFDEAWRATRGRETTDRHRERRAGRK